MRGDRASGTARTAFLISRRYLFARSHGYATFINWVSFFGLALGVMTLTVVVSVMNGFDREITGRILSVVPHAVASPAPAEAGGIDAVARVPGVEHASRFFQGEAMLAAGGTVHFIALAGLDTHGLRHLAETIDAEAVAALRDLPGGIVLGAPLAAAKRLELGDPVTLVVTVPTGTRVRPRVERFVLAGTFEIGADPDAALGIVGYDEVRRRGLTGAGVDGLRIQFAAPLAAPAAVHAIRDALGDASRVTLWTEDYGDLFRAVQIEKGIMFALLALIVAIAAFNIVSGQAMLVNDKRGDIAMLATMGASRGLVVGVFYLQGFAVAFIGVAAGLLLGVVVAANAGALAGLLDLVGASIIEDTWFSEVPSEVRLVDLAVIAALSLGLSTVAVLAPALRAVRENPATALHGP